MASGYILVYSIIIPIIAGFACLAFTDRYKNVVKTAAFVVTLASLAASIYVFSRKPLSWQAASYTLLTVDNLSGFVSIGISFFALIVTVYSYGMIEKDLGRYFGYVIMTLGCSLGVAYANNLILLLTFWGFLAITLYLLVIFQDTGKALASAKKALIIIGGTDGLLLFGAGLLWMMTGTFSMDAMHVDISSGLAMAAYLCIAVACFAKAGVVPLHSWLPDVADNGPIPVSAYLPASLDKLLGIYLLTKASTQLFVMNSATNLLLLAVGSFTIVFGVTIALIQHDFKRLLGYHAVSQVGYMVLGIGTGTPIGIAGGMFHMLNNTIYKCCLFLTAGAVQKRAGTTDLNSLGGLIKYMPVTFICCVTASLSISGIPPLNGFVSKWMIYQGIIELGNSAGHGKLWVVWLVSAMFGSVLTLASFMKLLHAVFMGRSSKDIGDIKEVGLEMAFPMVLLSFLCVIFGVWAYSLPLAKFIIPAVGKPVTYLGVWSPTAASGFILVGIFLGFIIHRMMQSNRSRVIEPFIGGEDGKELERVSGVEFYNTIKEIGIFRVFYKMEEAQSFDIYPQSARVVSFFSRIFQYLHNGVLPTYLSWCLLGMITVFFIFLVK